MLSEKNERPHRFIASMSTLASVIQILFAQKFFGGVTSYV